MSRVVEKSCYQLWSRLRPPSGDGRSLNGPLPQYFRTQTESSPAGVVSYVLLWALEWLPVWELELVPGVPPSGVVASVLVWALEQIPV